MLLSKFEQRLKDHNDTVAKNDKVIAKLKEIENQHLERLKQTLERQKSIVLE